MLKAVTAVPVSTFLKHCTPSSKAIKHKTMCFPAVLQPLILGIPEDSLPVILVCLVLLLVRV